MRKKYIIFPVFTALFATAVYLYTAPGSMFWLDSGRFLASIKILGIPNPPGFPLYMLLGHVFTYLPFGNILFRVRMVSLLASVAILLLVFRTIKFIILDKYKFLNHKQHQYNRHCEDSERSVEGEISEIALPAERARNDNNILILLAGLFGMISLAFSYTFWAQVSNIETFMLVALIDLTVITILILPKPYKLELFVRLLIIAFLMGIATGVNPVVISVMPAVALFTFAELKRLGFNRFSFVLLAGIAGTFLIYAYFPIRAQQHPFINWNNIHTLNDMFQQMTGKGLNVYVPELERVNGFTGSPEVFFKSLGHYFEVLFPKFTFALIPFMLVGFYALYKKSKYIFWVILLTMTTNILLSSLYLSGNQENWYLISDVNAAILTGIGYYFVAGKLLKVRDGKKIAVVLSLVSLVPLVVWWPNLDRHNTVISDDYVKNVYKSAKEPSIIVGSADIFDSLSYYNYLVLGYKPKVLPVIDNLLYLDSWYSDNLKLNADIIIPDRSKFTFDTGFEFSKFLNDFFDLNSKKYHVYTTFPALRSKIFPSPFQTGSLTIDEKRFKLIPQGLLFEIIPLNDEMQGVAAPDLNNFNYIFKTPGFPKKRLTFLEHVYNTEQTGMVNEYAYSFYNLGDYFLEQGDKDKALLLYKKGKDINPNNSEIRNRFEDVSNDVIPKGASASAFTRAPLGFKRYKSKTLGIAFFHQPDWNIQEQKQEIKATDPRQSITISMNLSVKPANVSADKYVAAAKNTYGTLQNQGKAKIPQAEEAQVKVWQEKSGEQKLQFFLFNQNKVLELLVSPYDGISTKLFDPIIYSLQF
ncbi:MAG: hypothetical protein A3F31_02120 [Candidatus Levybacteria bacterium RIFCSPHIGHO2_12_FULL_38_12]|nr:MAG: hypothetical protein A3F31_02120 [Candidatus Levybacteria bacterium RIFCSPHIGHO2_12_FULL_38_12]OGH51705.1 MAG: hypothetical protein A3G13_00715 [Candidatus Levybacteria bacterium RIFCSPLOWO2_12_FULL_37_7]